MLVEVLSDHGRQQLLDSRQRLEAAEHTLDARQLRYHRAHQEFRDARRGKALWRRMIGASTPQERDALARTRSAWEQVTRAEHGKRQMHHRVSQQSAGQSGEDALVQGLSGLSDEWVMLRGYRNRRGETDHVLVGPLGLWAVEVKRRRIRLHVDGDHWWYEKVDNWGNIVETGRAVDGGGRTWARQVNDIAGALATWLGRNGHQVPVRTGVMLLHERAELGRCRKLTVDMIGSRPAQLLDAIKSRSTSLSPDACGEITRLIRRDHHHHAKRRRSG